MNLDDVEIDHLEDIVGAVLAYWVLGEVNTECLAAATRLAYEFSKPPGSDEPEDRNPAHFLTGDEATKAQGSPGGQADRRGVHREAQADPVQSDRYLLLLRGAGGPPHREAAPRKVTNPSGSHRTMTTANMSADDKKRADELLAQYMGDCDLCTNRPTTMRVARGEADAVVSYKHRKIEFSVQVSDCCPECQRMVEQHDSDLTGVLRSRITATGNGETWSVRVSWRALALPW